VSKPQPKDTRVSLTTEVLHIAQKLATAQGLSVRMYLSALVLDKHAHAIATKKPEKPQRELTIPEQNALMIANADPEMLAELDRKFMEWEPKPLKIDLMKDYPELQEHWDNQQPIEDVDDDLDQILGLGKYKDGQ
jgi:predicted transcriptional regulator